MQRSGCGDVAQAGNSPKHSAHMPDLSAEGWTYARRRWRRVDAGADDTSPHHCHRSASWLQRTCTRRRRTTRRTRACMWTRSRRCCALARLTTGSRNTVVGSLRCPSTSWRWRTRSRRRRVTQCVSPAIGSSPAWGRRRASAVWGQDVADVVVCTIATGVVAVAGVVAAPKGSLALRGQPVAGTFDSALSARKCCFGGFCNSRWSKTSSPI
jgi:hypothetical protein